MNLLIFMDSVKFFSIKRLKSYKNEQEHKKNFLLVQVSLKDWHFWSYH